MFDEADLLVFQNERSRALMSFALRYRKMLEKSDAEFKAYKENVAIEIDTAMQSNLKTTIISYLEKIDLEQKLSSKLEDRCAKLEADNADIVASNAHGNAKLEDRCAKLEVDNADIVASNAHGNAKLEQRCAKLEADNAAIVASNAHGNAKLEQRCAKLEADNAAIVASNAHGNAKLEARCAKLEAENADIVSFSEHRNAATATSIIKVSKCHRILLQAFKPLKAEAATQLDETSHALADTKNKLLNGFRSVFEETDNFFALQKTLQKEKLLENQNLRQKIQELEQIITTIEDTARQNAVNETTNHFEQQEQSNFERNLREQGITLKKHATFPKKKSSYKQFHLAKNLLRWDNKSFDLSHPCTITREAQNGESKCFELSNPVKTIIIECGASWIADDYYRRFKNLVGTS